MSSNIGTPGQCFRRIPWQNGSLSQNPTVSQPIHRAAKENPPIPENRSNTLIYIGSPAAFDYFAPCTHPFVYFKRLKGAGGQAFPSSLSCRICVIKPVLLLQIQELELASRPVPALGDINVQHITVGVAALP